MKSKKRKEVEEFVENQKAQLGLTDNEAREILEQSLLEADESEEVVFDELQERQAASVDNFQAFEPAPDAPKARRAAPSIQPRLKKSKGKEMSDPYLPESQTIKARPTRTSKIRSLLYEHALPNEYIVQIGVRGAVPVLGGRFLKLGKKFLKFPAAVQTVYFTSDNANKNYQGLRIDGYACWRIDPEKPDLAAKSLDFSDQDNPMGNTNRILRTICTEAIRHLIANITIEEALTKKDEIGRDLKAQLQRIERTWGILFDQVGIERVTILSSQVFDDLQQKTRDALRLTATESRLETDREIERKKADYTEEMERLERQSEKEARILRATSESEIHKIELEEQTKREAEERKAEEDRHRAQAEFSIKAAETEARVSESRTKSDLIKAEAEHNKAVREQEFAALRSQQTLEEERRLENERLAAEMERSAARFAQTLKERLETAQADHETDLKRLERLGVEEELRNRLSSNRVLADLVDRLPEIASAIGIDRYTVLDGSGASPLSYTLAQILSLLDEHGLKKYLKEAEPEVEKVQAESGEEG